MYFVSFPENISVISLHNIKNNWPALKPRRTVFTAWYELIKEVNLSTVRHGFSNSGARATTGTTTTVYWYTALLNTRNWKKKYIGVILKRLIFI
jgi:hypothetical protein